MYMNGKTDQHIGFPCVLKERKTSSKNMLIEPRVRALLSRPCGSSGKSVTKRALGKRRERMLSLNTTWTSAENWNQRWARTGEHALHLAAAVLPCGQGEYATDLSSGISIAR